MGNKKVVLLTIDPQVDFCTPAGKLSVKGADKDMERLAKMVRRCKKDLDDIIVTLDSHRSIHIAHPVWWIDEKGNHPNHYTLISEDDVTGNNPKWRAYNKGFQQRSVEYVKKLKQNGRYALYIWPPHCLIGSDGYKVQPVLFEALCDWEDQFAMVNYITKGSNPYTEHYSAVCADVYDAEDAKGTGLNTDLLDLLKDPDVTMIGLAGEASSHCLKFTAEDVANNFGEDNIKKFVFLEDCASPVTGFEQQAADFVNAMTKRGMKVMTSDKFLK